MPYSGPSDPSIPSNVPKSKKAQWVEVWNSTYKDCISGGGSASTCETKAFRIANGVIKKKKKEKMMADGLWKAVTDFIHNIRTGLDAFQQRAVNISGVGNAAYMALEESGAYLTDLYFEGSQMFAIANKDGKLYRADITVSDSGDISVGELIEVVTKFENVSRSTFRTNSDGKVQMLSVSATSVLNKDSEIDSRDLFDAMSDFMLKTGKRIPRTFFHAGDQFRSGDIVWMGRDENALLTLTEFDDSELARKEISAREKDPAYWGDSIEYDPVGEPELWDVGDGVAIPVYKAGIPIAVSTLPAERACSHYANKFSIYRQEVNRMTLGTTQREALIKMFDGDEEAVDKWLVDHVDEVNRQISDTGQVTRETEEETAESEETPAETEPEEVVEEVAEEPEEISEEIVEEPTAQEPLVLEFDDEMAHQVADTVMASNLFTEFRQTITDAIAGFKDEIAALTKSVSELQALSVAREKEIKKLAQKDSEKQREWLDDLPRNTPRTVTFRPSKNAIQEDPAKRSMSDIAEETLSKIQ